MIKGAKLYYPKKNDSILPHSTLTALIDITDNWYLNIDDGLTNAIPFITSAEREVKVSRRSGMYQSYNFLTRLGMQSL